MRLHSLCLPLLFALHSHAAVVVHFGESAQDSTPNDSAPSTAWSWGSTTDAGFGTHSINAGAEQHTFTATQFTGGGWSSPGGGVPDLDPTGVSGGRIGAEYGGAHTPSPQGSFSYSRMVVDFGNTLDAGMAIRGRRDLVHVDDLDVSVSSLNGKSGYYEWGFVVPLDSAGNPLIGGSFSAIEAGLSSYSAADWAAKTEISSFPFANDDINNIWEAGDPAGSVPLANQVDGQLVSATGSQNGNNVFNNTDWGLTGNQAVSGFAFYAGLFSMGDDALTSGSAGDDPQLFDTTSANHYLQNFTTVDTNKALAVTIPEPSRAMLGFLSLGLLALRRKR